MQESKKTGKDGFRTENPFGAEHCQIKVNPFVALFWALVIVLATSYPVLQKHVIIHYSIQYSLVKVGSILNKDALSLPPPPHS